MNEPTGLELDNQVCFALYRASRAVIQMYRPVLDKLGLTYPQYLVMLVLWERGPISVKDLGHALDLDSGTLSPLLKRLEAAGLVSRSRSSADERSVEIALTDDGERLRERAAPIPRKLARATDLELAELRALRQQLTALAETINERRLSTDELQEG